MAGSAHIRNPLSIIGIFAGLVEVIGIGTLPFLSESIQKTYIWFLMAFPLVLVLAFFFTLIKYPKSLYAPGDFQEDSSWLKANLAPASEGQINRKIEASISEELPNNKLSEGAIDSSQNETQIAKAEVSKSPPLFSQQAGVPIGADGRQPTKIPRKSASEIDFLKKQAIDLIGTQKGLNFTRNLTFGNDNSVIDAISLNQLNTTLVEIKYTAMGYIPLSIVQNTFMRADRIYRDMPTEQQKSFNFIFAVICGNDVNRGQIEVTLKKITDTAREYQFSTMPWFMRETELSIE